MRTIVRILGPGVATLAAVSMSCGLAQAQDAAVRVTPASSAGQSPPEPVRIAPPPAMIYTTEAPSTGSQVPPADVFVRITAGGRELWSGDLRVEAQRGAQFNMTLQQGDAVCADQSERQIYARRQTGLNFTLRQAYGRSEGQPLSLTASWTRPSADCALPGTRTVGIDTAIVLAPGQSRAIEGDGGLRIELTRRR